MGASEVWRFRQVGFWEKYGVPLCLVVTTALSSVLIVAHLQKWTVNDSWYESSLAAITSKRAAVQSGIQLVAAILGLIHTSTVAVLIQHGTRLAVFNAGGSTTQSLKGLINLGLPRIRWDLQFRFLVPILALSCLGLISSALWVGSMTPVSSTIVERSVVQVPSFKNTTMIKEYPSEISRAGPSTTTREGLFTYSVGVKLLSSLIVSGSSATTSDGSVRRHPKIDNTQFVYEGRSYGVGSAIGIRDQAIGNRASAIDYSFQEDGYLPLVRCIYNTSMNYAIGREFPKRTYATSGWLPDSIGSPNFFDYLGHSPDSIVAVGVAHSSESPRRYISIAAGKNYIALNATQCTVDFSPTRFNVSVGIRGRNITVTPAGAIDDFNPQRNLTRTVVRQFELISNDLTSFYESILGNAFLSSVSAWNMSSNENGTVPQDEVTLRGLEKAIVAMTESMLASYGAAQLVVGNFSEQREANVTVGVFVIGEKVYVVAIAVLNALVVLAVIWEAVRTRGWRDLPPFDFSDPDWLITASFRGGVLSRASEADGEGGMVSQGFQKGPHSFYSPVAESEDKEERYVSVVAGKTEAQEVLLVVHDWWHEIIEDYSERELTIGSDRLPALAGCGRNFGGGRADGDTYLADLWKSQLTEDLMWESKPLKTKAIIRDLSHFRPPTWSWISIRDLPRSHELGEPTAPRQVSNSSSIRRRFGGQDESDALLVDYSIRLAHASAPFGDVSGGTLTLRAKIVSIGDVRPGVSREAVLMGSNYVLNAQEEAGVCLLRVQRASRWDVRNQGRSQDGDGCLLVMKDSSGTGFRRVGTFWDWWDSAEGRPAFDWDVVKYTDVVLV